MRWLPGSSGTTNWPGAPERDTINRIIRDTGLPASQADVVAVVTVLARAAHWDPGDTAGRARDLWVAAQMGSARSPASRIRVSDADPRRLGVHAAISVPGVPDDVLPEYVSRDADDAEFASGPRWRPSQLPPARPRASPTWHPRPGEPAGRLARARPASTTRGPRRRTGRLGGHSDAPRVPRRRRLVRLRRSPACAHPGGETPQ
jgi:hypothetical protein